MPEHVPDRAALRLQHRVLAAAREYLDCAGFVELLPPILGPAADPGTPVDRQADVEFQGRRYKLMTSSALQRQVALLALDRTYRLAPDLGPEPPTESHRLDVEVAGATREQVMRLAEDLVVHVAARVQVELRGPFGQYTYADMAKLEPSPSAGEDRPYFVTDYDRALHGFSDRVGEDGSGTRRNFELFLPDGPDRLGSGSELEHEYAKVLARIRETGENPARYASYLTLVREGIPASAGFGVGVERLTRYLLLSGRDDSRRNCPEAASSPADSRRDASLASSASGI